MSERDPYLRILIAAEQGKGIRLSAQEVINLSLDDAIETAALFDISEKDHARLRRLKLRNSKRYAEQKP